LAGDVTEGSVLVPDRGPVTVLEQGPRRGRRLLLAHGAGGTARSPFLSQVSDGLASAGFRVVRFNFPYSEAGRRSPDRAALLLATWRAVVDSHGGDGGAVLAGKSMGGRYATLLLAEPDPPAAVGVVLFGYPLHPPGRIEQLRTEHLPRVQVPMLFLSGTRDPLARLDLLEPAIGDLPRATLHLVDGGDHDFRVKARPSKDVMKELVDATVAFATA